MIRLDERDSATLATIAQYQQLPEEMKQSLVERLSEEAKPIGMILIGTEPRDPSEEVVEIANEFREWTQMNRMSRSSANAAPVLSRETALVGSR